MAATAHERYRIVVQMNKPGLTDGPRLNGTDLFRVICEQDMQVIVAKQASAR
jgi:hypothetical protein